VPTILQDPAKLHDAVSVFQTKPLGGNRFVVMHVDVVSSTELLVAWDGRTYPYGEKFDAAGVLRSENVRFLPNEFKDISQEATHNKILEVMGAGVLNDVVCNLLIKNEEEATADSEAAKFLETLKAMPHVYVAGF
jgi:hypothetical protein